MGLVVVAASLHASRWDTMAGELKLFPFVTTLAGSYDTPGRARYVAIAGDYAYVADEYSGLQVVDITNPESPQIVGSVDTPGRALDVAGSGAYAYVADEESGLLMLPAQCGGECTPVTMASSPVFSRTREPIGTAPIALMNTLSNSWSKAFAATINRSASSTRSAAPRRTPCCSPT